MAARKFEGAHTSRFCKDRRQQVRVARAVDHPTARNVYHGTRKHVSHPVATLHPSPVVPPACGLESRPHGQKVFEGDPFLGRIGRLPEVLGKEISNGLPYTLDVTPIDGNPNEYG